MKIAVIGAGLGGLASAALLASKGHQVDVFEQNSWLGGKSRRIELNGSYVDTGPSLFTFPGVWQKFLDTYDRNLGGEASKDLANLELIGLPTLGSYYFNDEMLTLPVDKSNPLFAQWNTFAAHNEDLLEPITDLLTTDPSLIGKDAIKLMKSTSKLVGQYGLNLTTEKYVDHFKWMDPNLKEIIKIHTLNAGVGPGETLAIFATMAAIMADNGVSIPYGGINEVPQAIGRMIEHAGGKIHLSEGATKLSKNRLTTNQDEYEFDVCVSSVDENVLKTIRGEKPKHSGNYSCSGVAIYAAFEEPMDVLDMHSVIMPDEPDFMHQDLNDRKEPSQTMTFLNYYPEGEIYPGKFDSAAILLTAPANNKDYDLESDWVQTQLEFIEKKIDVKIPEFADHKILDPSYFSTLGTYGGALYGKKKPFWVSGPFHQPSYKANNWLYRVGSQVHPGGGIPAVLGGAMIATGRIR
jgi:phytoene desaturase